MDQLAENWTLSEGASLSFAAGDVSLTEARSGAVLLLGEEENVTVFDISEAAQTYIRDGVCYLGPCRMSICEEKYAGGLRVGRRVGRLLEKKGFTVQMYVMNESDQPVRLKQFDLLKTAGHDFVFQGDASDWVLHSLTHSARWGNLHDVLDSEYETQVRICRGFGIPYAKTPPDDERQTDGHWRLYTDFATVYRSAGKEGVALMAVGAPEADVQFSFHVEDGALMLEAVSDGNDIVIDPGESRSSQEIVVLFEEYDQAVELTLHWLKNTHGTRTQKPPLTGWCSWYDLGQQIREEDVSRVVECFAGQKGTVDVDVIQIDDGYQKCPGDWDANEKFPGGLKKLTKRIQEIGCMAGIWLAPLAVHCSLTQYDGLLQRNRAGECVGGCSNWGEVSNMLDPTLPAAQEMLREIIRSKKRDGFTYFKIDFNNVNGDARFYDVKKTRLQAYRDLYRLYREEVGEEGYLLSCSGFTRGSMGFADASRIGPDSDCVWKADYTCTISDAMQAVGLNAPANGVFYWNDPDVTYLKSVMGIFDPVDGKIKGDTSKPAISEDELRVWHSMVGLLGGLALISDPVYREDYQALLPRLQMIAPGCPEKAVSLCAATDPMHSLFGFFASRPYGDFVDLLVWNPGEQTRDVPLAVQLLDTLGEVFYVWSFWDEAYLGEVGRDFVVRGIGTHAGKVLRCTKKAADRPVLLGTNLHITMGGAEVSDIQYEMGEMHVLLNHFGLNEGNLYFYSEAPLRLVNGNGCVVLSVEQTQENVWRVSVRRDRTREQELVLAFSG